MSRARPIHRQIADQLRQRIVAGHFEVSELPPELVLKQEFGVSRHTIRSALQSLVQDGLIERRAGRGTRLTKKAQSGAWAVGSLESIIGEFSVAQSLTISIELVPAGNYPQMAALFQVPKPGKLLHVLRVFPRESHTFAVSNAFTAAKFATHLPAGEIAMKPVIGVVEERCGQRAVRARQLATAAAADEETARRLAIRVGDPILVLHRTYFNFEDEPLVHAEMLCRPDRYQQIVDFVREPGNDLKEAAFDHDRSVQPLSLD